MRNYNVDTKQMVPTPPRLSSFLDEVEALCKKHQLTISMTACDGLMVTDYNQVDISLLRESIFSIKDSN